MPVSGAARAQLCRVSLLQPPPAVRPLAHQGADPWWFPGAVSGGRGEETCG